MFLKVWPHDDGFADHRHNPVYRGAPVLSPSGEEGHQNQRADDYFSHSTVVKSLFKKLAKIQKKRRPTPSFYNLIRIFRIIFCPDFRQTRWVSFCLSLCVQPILYGRSQWTFSLWNRAYVCVSCSRVDKFFSFYFSFYMYYFLGLQKYTFFLFNNILLKKYFQGTSLFFKLFWIKSL